VPPAPGHVDRGEPDAGDGAGDGPGDAVAHLLQHDRHADVGDHGRQARGHAAPAHVPTGLQRLLQRVDVEGERVGADLLDRPSRLLDAVAAQQLRRPEVAHQQHVGRHVTYLEGGARLRTLEHDALRPEHHAHAQPLRRLREVAVDAPRLVGAAGHGPDEQRRAQAPSEEVDGGVDAAEVRLGQRTVRQVDALEPGPTRLVRHGSAQAGLEMAQLAPYEGRGIVHGGVYAAARARRRKNRRRPPQFRTPA
jgi:hypothetical protein